MYPDADTRDALLADPASAPIPPLHREAFAFAERFVRNAWTTSAEDLEQLRQAGLSDRDIVQWATLGSTQSWFTMSADGGGIPLDGDATTGPGVGRVREAYEAAPGGLLAAKNASSPSANAAGTDAIAFVSTDENNTGYRKAADWAERRYGFVPNLLRAVSLRPSFYPRHLLALELLEAPQSKNLSARQHAMVRVIVSRLARGRYSERTASTLLKRVSGGNELAERLEREPLDLDWDPQDRAVLMLATKFASNAYKVTEKDAIGIREVGLDDEAYVDILNTVSIQTALDRLANVLGVAADSRPLLPDFPAQ